MNKTPANTSINMPIEPVYTVKECADKLKVTERTILELIRKQKLRAVKVGREYRITESAINGFIEGKPPTDKKPTRARKKQPS
jgi:excisionase family DNA binding protein